MVDSTVVFQNKRGVPKMNYFLNADAIVKQIVKPIFHHNVDPFALGPRIGRLDQHTHFSKMLCVIFTISMRFVYHKKCIRSENHPFTMKICVFF